MIDAVVTAPISKQTAAMNDSLCMKRKLLAGLRGALVRGLGQGILERALHHSRRVQQGVVDKAAVGGRRSQVVAHLDDVLLGHQVDGADRLDLLVVEVVLLQVHQGGLH